MNVEKKREPHKDDELAEYLLRIALDVGEGMLVAGGEISRVEDTVERICRAYGAEHVEVFSIISVINAAVRMPDGSYSSQLRRIKGTCNDLFRLELYNGISRELCRDTPPLEEAEKRLSAVKSRRAYPVWLRPIAFGAAASAFALFFGGGVGDCIAAALIGIALWTVDILNVRIANIMAKTLISAFAAGVLSFAAVAVGLGQNSGAILTGTIMLLVPGLSFGTALRDLLCGDLLAGTLKSIQAFLTALMIAFGYVLSIIVMGGGAL